MNSLSGRQSFSDIIDQFRHAMEVAGLKFDGQIKADTDSVQRFYVEGDSKGSLNGWYILHTDGIAAGEFGCWKRGIQSSWCSRDRDTLSDHDRRKIEARREADRARRDALTAEKHKSAAEQANIVWDAAAPCTSHPYLARKGVSSFGLRVGRWVKFWPDGGVRVDVADALLVPIRRGKSIVSMQAILPEKHPKLGNRDKDFLPGGEKRGCAFAIGKPAGDDATIVICEGYATGASIHMATGFPVLVAFDAGNLAPVAEAIRAKYPMATIIIAADNDRWTFEPVENPGLHFAKAAGAAHRAWVAVPEFADLATKPTDFNDLHALEGLERVGEIILSSVNPDTPDVVPETIRADAKISSDTPAPANENEVVVIPGADFISPLPHVTGKGKPLSTIENLMEVCRRLRVTVRYNVISKEIELLIPGEGFSIDNESNASLAWLTSACARFGMPVGQLGDFLCYLADRNPFNPVAQWITSKAWDGKSRLIEFMSTIKAEGEEEDYTTAAALKEAMMRRWMISAVAAAFNPTGVSAHGVLVLQGPQYLGKTAWFKSLAPSELQVIQDGLILRPDDRDSVKQVVSYWMVELGELDATFRRSDIAQLKAFLTRQTDTLRRAYAKLESHYARRTVFFASVNPRQFLHDPTGNRRYWTISCREINHQHGMDMQQVWAEVYETLYKKGETWFLTPEELALLNEHNKDFEVLDPVKERLQTRYDWDAPSLSWSWKTATEIMLEIGFDRPSRADVTSCGHLVLEMNGHQSRKSNGKKLSLVPPLR